MTGRLLCRQGAIARKILVDGSGRANGIVWIDQQSGTTEQVYAPLIFVCASTLESTRLLLLSRSVQSPHGLGAASGVLGCGLMDHITVSVMGLAPPLKPGDDREQGRCLYLPRFDARTLSRPAPGRGFGVQIYQFPSSIGGLFFAVSFGEMTPRSENRVTLDPKRLDAWNIPILRIECGYNQSELLRAREQAIALRELAETARVRFTSIREVPAPPGSAIHECGTARMGADPSNSVLDPYNQCWEARGLYITDGASFPSLGAQNPTLTILALTARACDHAVRSAR
jgi:choline dehydrogenase-like flavoprotein